MEASIVTLFKMALLFQVHIPVSDVYGFPVGGLPADLLFYFPQYSPGSTALIQPHSELIDHASQSVRPQTLRHLLD